MATRMPAGDTLSLGGALPGYVGSRNALHLWSPVPATMVTRISGHLDVEAARFLATSVRTHLALCAPLRHTGFHDWYAMTDYDGEARVLLMDLVRDILPRVEAVHICIGSPAVAFGVKAASLVFPSLSTYASRASFDQRLAATLQRSKERQESAPKSR